MLFLKLLLVVLRFRRHLTEQTELLELTPPAFTEKSSYTTEQLFGLLHSLGGQRSLIERIFGYKTLYSLEIVSSKQDGIRYLVRVPGKDYHAFSKSALSYMPQLRINKVQDYLSNENSASNSRIIEIKLSNHFAYPLKKQNELEQHDPIAYLTGMMTKLSPQELISFQIILSPAKPIEAIRINHLLMRNDDVLEYLNKSSFSSSSSFLRILVWILYSLYSIPFWLISNIATNGNTPFLTSSSLLKSKENKTIFEKEIYSEIHEKVSQPLFETVIRMLVTVDGQNRLTERVRGLLSSFGTFSLHNYQSLVHIKIPRFPIVKKYLSFVFRKRIIGVTPISLLSVSEISDLFHFPYTRNTKTEDLVKTHSKQLPAPLALKKVSQLDSIFANNLYGGTSTPIGLTKEERRRHIYILGATGTGKSTLLLSMITQDIKNRKGICVIDPHGDLIEKILPSIPKERLQDVIYFNPDDIGYPIGINLLELSEGLSEEDSLREKEFITESIISLFHKIYADKYSGPRMEYILRNTIYTAYTVPNRTLFTVYKLLINTPFRKSVTNNLTDENLKDFWKYEFSKAGDYQKVKMISPITNKIGRFLFSPTAKRILEQEKSTINFDEIMDSGKILLCNLSKGRIGEDNSEVFGIVIMAKIQLAALKRARVDQENRKDYYLYVDEFQNFATPAFAQILSEARKYRLNAILAHQTTSQLEDKSLVHVTLANTGTIICFRTANPEDERLILPQFYPYINEGEIAALPSFNFYMKINAINPEEPFSGITIPFDSFTDKNTMKEVIAYSRSHYALKKIPTIQQSTLQVKDDRIKKNDDSKPGIKFA